MQAQPTLETAGRSTATQGPVLRHLRSAGRFALQFLEMCAAMCVGGIVLDFAFFQGVAALGYPDFFEANRGLSIFVIGLSWAVAMYVWMAFRHHPRRHSIEMSSTAVLTAVALIAAYWWFGFAPTSKIPGWLGQVVFQCGPSCAVMGAYMLLRHRHYAGADTAHQMA